MSPNSSYSGAARSTLLTLVLLLLAAAAASAAVFTCDGATRATCHALIDYLPANATTFREIQSLFGVKKLNNLLGANDVPISSSSGAVEAGRRVRVPFPCACADGRGVSTGGPIYAVRPGDTLDDIARKVFGGVVTYQEIAAASRVPNPNLIEAGQNLTIPIPCSCDPVDGANVVHYGHVVANGSSVEAIASAYGTTNRTLLRLNNMTNDSELMAGQLLDVPLKESEPIIILVLYDGVWRFSETKSCWSFRSKESLAMTISKDTHYEIFVDQLYEEIGVDKSEVDLELKVLYKFGGGDGLPIPPTRISNDANLHTWFREISSSIDHRTPLCVSIIPRASAEGVGGSAHVAEEPDVVAENSKTPGSQSSRVHKVREMEENVWSCPIFSDKEVPGSTNDNNIASSSGVNSVKIKLGQLFENKEELKTKLHLYAMRKNFEFKVKKSGPDVWYITCLDEKCGWRMRARKLQNSRMFEIRRFAEEHSCSLELRQKDNRQAAPWVIGHCIKGKYTSHEPNYLPRSIMSDMVKEYGINMTYQKAWRCREKALTYIRGTPEASYQKLPSYLYMLKIKNPGTITDLVVDDVGHFKYLFMALGACIRGFRAACRPILCVDGSFLKTKIKGTMLCAIAQDANKQLYPLAFSVVDGENNDSWMYFMLKLRESVGFVDNLVFVSDRHHSIASALNAVFPEAHHGACIQHIGMNITAKFHTDHCHQEYFLAAKAYRRSEFHYHFDKIMSKDPPIAEYLQSIGFERWSRAYFPGCRYNIMTSNVAESFNNKTKNARKWPITSIAEFLRFTIQSWFYDRRNEAEKSTLPIAKKMDDELQELFQTAQTLTVQPLSQFEFYVMDGDRDGEVNLQTKSCSCGKFQLTGLPCEHALACARDRNINPYTLCSRYYSNEAWLNCYAETIYPIGNEDEWFVPAEIKSIVVHPPVEKKMPGRPKTNRRTSQGERVKVHRRCSSCGGT